MTCLEIRGGRMVAILAAVRLSAVRWQAVKPSIKLTPVTIES